MTRTHRQTARPALFAPRVLPLVAALSLTFSLAFSLAFSPGCYPYSSEVQLCDEIPENGCPKGRGGTCDDPVCAALYDCIDGLWEKTETCEGNAVGGAGGATTGSGGAGGSGGACTPITFDHSDEKIGCMPDLQSPDCPVVAAEQCPESACLTDCTDFFMCKQEGWIAIAYCDDKGAVIATAR